MTAKDDDGECHNGYGLALKNLKQYEQATGEFKKAIDDDPELYDALYNCGMAYADWFDEAHGNDQKDKAREYLQKFVGSSSKTTDPNYVKAANDKLYALSRTVRSQRQASQGGRCGRQRAAQPFVGAAPSIQRSSKATENHVFSVAFMFLAAARRAIKIVLFSSLFRYLANRYAGTIRVWRSAVDQQSKQGQGQGHGKRKKDDEAAAGGNGASNGHDDFPAELAAPAKAAFEAEKQSVEKGIDAWKKLVASAPDRLGAAA